MTALLDGASVFDRKQMHQILARELALPEWYGGNLDALFDCLTDRRGETLLHIDHFPQLEEHLGSGYIRALLRMLRRVQEENPDFRFTVSDDRCGG